MHANCPEFIEVALRIPLTSFQNDWTKLHKQKPGGQRDKQLGKFVAGAGPLDATIFGMKRAKDEIMMELASALNSTERRILAFMGPPGVGKTELARALGHANALNLPFRQVSMGGTTDAHFVLGHSSTYVGAKPGVVAQSVIDMEYNNGILYVDELDKVGKQVAEALLHVFDPVQNATFTDNYFPDVPVDLSNIFFVCSLNRIDNLDPKLLDRLAIVSVDGYDKEEKTVIANDFLLGKIIQDAGFALGEVLVGKEALAVILDIIEKDEQLLAQHEDATDREHNVYRQHHHTVRNARAFCVPQGVLEDAGETHPLCSAGARGVPGIHERGRATRPGHRGHGSRGAPNALPALHPPVRRLELLTARGHVRIKKIFFFTKKNIFLLHQKKYFSSPPKKIFFFSTKKNIFFSTKNIFLLHQKKYFLNSYFFYVSQKKMNAMPPEILWKIMEYLPLQMLWRLRSVSSRLRAVMLDYLHRHKYTELEYRLYHEVMYCVQQSRIDGVRFWLNVNAGVNSRFANRIWNGEVVRLLTSAFLMAIDNRDTETAQLLLENGADLHGLQSSGLRNAVRYGDIKTVEMLLEKGANVAVERHEPLMTATFYGCTHMVNCS